MLSGTGSAKTEDKPDEKVEEKSEEQTKLPDIRLKIRYTVRIFIMEIVTRYLEAESVSTARTTRIIGPSIR
jgi:hypothetical protein